MNFVVKNKKTGLLCGVNSAWVADYQNALVFPSATMASIFCIQHRLSDVEFVVWQRHHEAGF